MLRLGARLPGLTIALGALLLVVGIVRGMVILDVLGAVGLIAGGAGVLNRGRTRRCRVHPERTLEESTPMPTHDLTVPDVLARTATAGDVPRLKVFTAIRHTQGDHTNDYAHAIDGELVIVGLTCGRDTETPHTPCRCTRSFVGMSSHKATTTAAVTELATTRDTFVEAVRLYYRDIGLLRPDDETDEVDAEADELLEIAAKWPTGTVIGRQRDTLYVRYLGHTATT